MGESGQVARLSCTPLRILAGVFRWCVVCSVCCLLFVASFAVANKLHARLVVTNDTPYELSGTGYSVSSDTSMEDGSQFMNSVTEPWTPSATFSMSDKNNKYVDGHLFFSLEIPSSNTADDPTADDLPTVEIWLHKYKQHFVAPVNRATVGATPVIYTPAVDNNGYQKKMPSRVAIVDSYADGQYVYDTLGSVLAQPLIHADGSTEDSAATKVSVAVVADQQIIPPGISCDPAMVESPWICSTQADPDTTTTDEPTYESNGLYRIAFAVTESDADIRNSSPVMAFQLYDVTSGKILGTLGHRAYTFAYKDDAYTGDSSKDTVDVNSITIKNSFLYLDDAVQGPKTTDQLQIRAVQHTPTSTETKILAQSPAFQLADAAVDTNTQQIDSPPSVTFVFDMGGTTYDAEDSPSVEMFDNGLQQNRILPYLCVLGGSETKCLLGTADPSGSYISPSAAGTTQDGSANPADLYQDIVYQEDSDPSSVLISNFQPSSSSADYYSADFSTSYIESPYYCHLVASPSSTSNDSSWKLVGGDCVGAAGVTGYSINWPYPFNQANFLADSAKIRAVIQNPVPTFFSLNPVFQEATAKQPREIDVCYLYENKTGTPQVSEQCSSQQTELLSVTPILATQPDNAFDFAFSYNLGVIKIQSQDSSLKQADTAFISYWNSAGFGMPWIVSSPPSQSDGAYRLDINHAGHNSAANAYNFFLSGSSIAASPTDTFAVFNSAPDNNTYRDVGCDFVDGSEEINLSGNSKKEYYLSNTAVPDPSSVMCEGEDANQDCNEREFPLNIATADQEIKWQGSAGQLLGNSIGTLGAFLNFASWGAYLSGDYADTTVNTMAGENTQPYLLRRYDRTLDANLDPSKLSEYHATVDYQLGYAQDYNGAAADFVVSYPMSVSVVDSLVEQHDGGDEDLPLYRGCGGALPSTSDEGYDLDGFEYCYLAGLPAQPALDSSNNLYQTVPVLNAEDTFANHPELIVQGMTDIFGNSYTAERCLYGKYKNSDSDDDSYSYYYKCNNDQYN